MKGASLPLVLSLLSLSVFRFRREEITKKAVSEWVQIHLDGRPGGQGPCAGPLTGEGRVETELVRER